MTVDPTLVSEAVYAAVGTVVTVFLGIAVKELRLLRHSVEELNMKMATLMERVHSHEQRISKLEKGKKA